MKDKFPLVVGLGATGSTLIDYLSNFHEEIESLASAVLKYSLYRSGLQSFVFLRSGRISTIFKGPEKKTENVRKSPNVSLCI